jgi:transposase
VDESGFHNHVRTEYGWSPRGEIIFGERKSRPTEKLNLLGGLLNNEIIAPLAYQSYTDTEIFNTWLKKCLIPALPKNCIIVMDNARFHKSEETREIIEDNGHQLLFLPPYSPDLNPIENYWAILKGKLRKIVANFQNLFDALTAVFQTI